MAKIDKRNNRVTSSTRSNDGFLNDGETSNGRTQPCLKNLDNLQLPSSSLRAQYSASGNAVALTNRVETERSRGRAAVGENPLGLPVQRDRNQLALRQRRNVKQGHNNILITIIVAALLATPFVISMYVLLQHEMSVKAPCTSNNEVRATAQTSCNEDVLLKRLMDEVKTLHRKNKMLLAGITRERNDSLRYDRKARENVTGICGTGNQDMLQNFTERTKIILRQCSTSIKKIRSKVLQMRHNHYKCVFHEENRTKAEQTADEKVVRVTQLKSDAFQLVGVTCCGNRRLSNTSNILSVKVTPTTITYTCRCALRHTCRICYWRCGNH